MTHDSVGAVTRQLRAAAWRTSSFSSGGECVSVRQVDDHVVALRNSKHPEAGTLRFAGCFAAWVAGCKASEFDDLTT